MASLLIYVFFFRLFYLDVYVFVLCCVAQSLSPWSNHCSVTSTKQPHCSFACFRRIGFHLYLCMCERVFWGAQWKVAVNGGACIGRGAVKSLKRLQHLTTSSHRTCLHIFPSFLFSPYPSSHFLLPRQSSIKAAAVLYTNSLCSPAVQKEKI